MLVSFVIEIVCAFFGFLVGKLPVGSVTVSASTAGSDAATAILNGLGALSGLVPVQFFLTVVVAFLLMIPVVLILLVFEWGYEHLPTVAGFGP